MAKNILVIDDDENIRRFISLLLTENGYEAVTASDGAEGLQMVTQAKPDLIVLDVMMPKKTGLTLFRQLKRDEQLKDIPVLMLTGVTGVIEDMEAHKDDTFEHPFDNLREALKKSIRELRDEGLVKPEMFVDKPVDPDSFVERVKQLIGT
jgi:CheY-like chemotaxis protein